VFRPKRLSDDVERTALDVAGLFGDDRVRASNDAHIVPSVPPRPTWDDPPQRAPSIIRPAPGEAAGRASSCFPQGESRKRPDLVVAINRRLAPQISGIVSSTGRAYGQQGLASLCLPVTERTSATGILRDRHPELVRRIARGVDGQRFRASTFPPIAGCPISTIYGSSMLPSYQAVLGTSPFRPIPPPLQRPADTGPRHRRIVPKRIVHITPGPLEAGYHAGVVFFLFLTCPFFAVQTAQRFFFSAAPRRGSYE
jgi:hypothetical protein